ncbi:MAG: response regulator transcription factor [Chitinophagaceae bacterium]|nr:MAG: response regulator transcription factor [Chitinophagaceae bacterium]
MNEHNKLNCLIVDDEPPAVDVLRTYVASVSALQLVGVCHNAIEASNFLQVNPVDVMFLDIQMPLLLGTDLVRTLKNPPDIIFTTAYRKFAIDGFELDAVDYLLKPISFERFLKAVNKVMHTRSRMTDDKTSIENVVANQFIHLRVDRKNVKLALDDILFVESLKDYVKVVTATRNIITKQSISSLEEMLPGKQFVRIHRSYIVSVDKITTFTSNTIGIGKHELPISRMYRLDVERQLRY